MSRAPSRAPSRAASRAGSDERSQTPSSPEAPFKARSASKAPERTTSEHIEDFKRIVVCCDGTWQDSAQGLDHHGNLIPPTNVTRITRAIRAVSKDGIPQVTYYQGGVGSTGTQASKIIEGTTGEGLADNVREAYSFIANNWLEGDEIFLIGFSRGAFTARSVAGLISHIGIMTKAGLPAFPVVFEDFAHRNKRRYRSPQPDIPFTNKPAIRDPIYMKEMERRGLTTLGVSIKAIGVWDTVGSLGIPRISWLSRFGQRKDEPVNDYAFYDTNLSSCIDNAFQALALDEKRASFSPAVWEKRRNEHTNLVQVWFPGVHANVGGGYDDQELANITLAWMMSMLSPFLDMNLNYILREDNQNLQYYESRRGSPRPWSFGKIYDSVVGAFAIAGSIVRTPGNYTRADPKTGEATDRVLKYTHEYMHSSVRTRIRMHGPGYADKGDYDPASLRGWRLASDDIVAGSTPTGHFWEQEKGGIILPEAPLRPVEKMLLKSSPESEDYLFGPPRSKSRRRS